ncbi:2-phospho-L-lactate guanylyltransferase [Natrialba taiwanensis]|uniref:2-phospho-L-lactate guanylyltransferase n=1 Tax=Natrialba taiwanensis DSM 12281 TaxID=1230458 RepID=L9ZS50_9EURY|nr:2-phospho-L-lactate guanylyltransferase [Natrialba taiwanensis]ELY88906.1 2-phospho-L-lactate guanylyltransferase CofC [Natrialba taiwanensis DSM 12281]
MQVVVPFASETPKTRLGTVLDPAERRSVARAMLADVLDALIEADPELDPLILSTAPIELDECDEFTDRASRPAVAVDDRPLTEAVNDHLAATAEPVAIVMADLALATPEAITGFVETPGDIVIAPGRGGGTNALVVRHPEFRVDYHGASYRDHRARAREVGATIETVDSFRLGTDIDEPADLAEVLLHGRGRTATTLREWGFELETSDGRVGVDRSAADSASDSCEN